MERPGSPLDIAANGRVGSNSPQTQTQTSNLTNALREAGASGMPTSAINIGVTGPNGQRPSLSAARADSINNGLFGSYYAGARPISMKDRGRRESAAGSFLNGMSWGGVSVGSWIRDDIMMAGTSPAPFNQSPSFHSSSYLPKMEANFMKDFTCCGLTLDSLHDLLQHFEEAHATASGQALPRTSSQSGQGGLHPNARADAGGNNHGFQSHDHSHSQFGFRPAHSGFRSHRQNSDGFNRSNLSTVQDMDTLDDMEMDDAGGLTPIEEQQSFQSQQQQQQQYGQNGNRSTPQLNINVANLNQGMRSSTPNTPSNQSFGLQHNPTVSSVNTPTLGPNSLQGQNKSSPESSVPGTPAEFDSDMAGGYMQGVPMGQMMGNDQGWGNFGFGAGMANLDGTIDQPAKRLFSKQNGLTQQQLQMAFRNSQMGEDSELAKRIREQQIMAGANIPPILWQEENKPFKCPVIGCEKAYKNQNGLKYHKQHGHQNQQLKENADGTFSIVDPLTSIPYPGTVGMEKEKPYRCEVCGKRYKNLNGLKYHRAHSPQCNPELKLQHLASLGALGPGLQGMNVNVAGAGITGIDGMF